MGDAPEERVEASRAEACGCDGVFETSVGRALSFGVGLKEIGRMAEETAVRQTVRTAQGNLRVAAQRLGVTERALQMRQAQKANQEMAE